MSTLQPAVFERNYGVRHITTAAGELLTSVSQPDWRNFMRGLGGAAAGQAIGRYIATPELMTVAEIDLAALQQNRSLIEDRIGEARDLTRLMPETTLLLGSAVFESEFEKPRNALLFLRDGEEIGRSYKRRPIVRLERLSMHVSPSAVIQKPAANILNIICSDFTKPQSVPFDNAVDTLLVSACWSAPMRSEALRPSSEARLTNYLQHLTVELFERHANLTTVVMTDRLPAESAASGPFNFVAMR